MYTLCIRVNTANWIHTQQSHSHSNEKFFFNSKPTSVLFPRSYNKTITPDLLNQTHFDATTISEYVAKNKNKIIIINTLCSLCFEILQHFYQSSWKTHLKWLITDREKEAKETKKSIVGVSIETEIHIDTFRNYVNNIVVIATAAVAIFILV